MTETPAGEQASKSVDTFKTIYFVVIGMVITTAVGSTFLAPDPETGAHELLWTLYPRFSLFLALLFTVLRFIQASVLRLEQQAGGGTKQLIDFLNCMVQAILFYLAAIAIDQPAVFMSLMLAIFLLDLVWLLLLRRVNAVADSTAWKQSVSNNAVMAAVFAGAVVFLRLVSFEAVVVWAATIAAIVAAAADYGVNWKYYFATLARR